MSKIRLAVLLASLATIVFLYLGFIEDILEAAYLAGCVTTALVYLIIIEYKITIGEDHEYKE